MFLTILILFTFVPLETSAAGTVSARNAILIEQQSGRILFEKAANEKRKIASITKIMTSILAIESDKLDETVTVSERAIRTEGSSLYLKKNEKIKLEHLVYGLMLRSGNDAAVAIAEHVGGSVEGFVFLMNQKAQEIGMSNTHFANPHGLDDSKDHYSTAYDMALLTQYAMKNETYKKIAGTEVYRAPNPDEKWDRVWRNKNRLLTQLYDYCTGGKTGYTKLAKRTLVTTATKGDLDLIAVTLNGPDDWNDHINMYETAFDRYQMAEVLSPGKIKSVDRDFYKGKIRFANGYYFPVKKEEKNLFRIDINLQKPKKEWKERRNTPEVVGKATVYFDEKLVKEMPIYYEDKKQQKESFFTQFKDQLAVMIGVNKHG
jgi:D-alanyl-D-alanine carboxypeptidase